LAARRESQSISYDGYLVRAKPAASSHGASLKSSCCISGTADSGEADGDGDGHEDSAADSRQDEDASSEDGEEQLLVGAEEDVAAAGADFLAPFLDAAMLWQMLELGVDGGVERAAGGGVVGEVEARRVAAEAVGGLVVGERRLLGGVEGAEPEAGAVAREADLRHPLAPVPLPHAAVQLLRPRRGRGRRRDLHGLGPRAQDGGLRLALLQVEAGLDVLHLGRAQLARPLGPGEERVPAVGGGGGGVVEGEGRSGAQRVVVLEKRTGFVRSRGIPDKRLECSHQLLPGQIYSGSHLDYSRSEETNFFLFFFLSSKTKNKSGRTQRPQ